jgi:hypothetical protein
MANHLIAKVVLFYSLSRQIHPFIQRKLRRDNSLRNICGTTKMRSFDEIFQKNLKYGTIKRKNSIDNRCVKRNR